MIVVAGLVPLAAATAAAPAASADQQSAARARLVTLRQELVQSGRDVHAATVAYDQAAVAVDALAIQLSEDQARVASDRAHLDTAEAALRSELITSYIGGYDAVPGAVTDTGGSVSDPAVREGYVSVATGVVQDQIDRYRAARLELASDETRVEAEVRAGEAAVASASRARSAALTRAGAAQSRLAVVERELAVLEATPAPGRARQTAPAPSIQGAPVNGGLVTMVRAQVAASLPLPLPPPNHPAVPVSTTTSTTDPAPSTTTLPVAPTTVASPPTTMAPSPAPVVAPTAGSADGGAGGVWLQLRQCESSDDYQADTGNGFYGAYQFSQQTWSGLGYPGRPDQEPPAMQDEAAMKLQSESGWGNWPACAAALGLS